MKSSIDEALRYLGIHTPDEEMRHQMTSLYNQLTAQVTPRSVWKVFAIQRSDHALLLPDVGITLVSASAQKMLQDCDQIVLLASTLGITFDSMLHQLEHRDLSEAVMLNACGSALIESVCDELQHTIASRFPDLYLTDRFSPGYGDLPLTLQQPILTALDAYRRIGITLTDTSLMNPTKSVTALIGLASKPQQARIRGCAYCMLAKSCTLKQRGVTCES